MNRLSFFRSSIETETEKHSHNVDTLFFIKADKIIIGKAVSVHATVHKLNCLYYTVDIG